MNQGLGFSSEVAASSLQDCSSHCVVQDLAWLKMYIYGCIYIWVCICLAQVLLRLKTLFVSRCMYLYIYGCIHIYICVYMSGSSHSVVQGVIWLKKCVYIYISRVFQIIGAAQVRRKCMWLKYYCWLNALLFFNYACVYIYMSVCVCGSSHCVAQGIVHVSSCYLCA